MSLKMKTSVKLRMAATGSSHSSTDVAVRDLQFAFDERGGTLGEEIEVSLTSNEQTVVFDRTASVTEVEADAAEVMTFCPLSKLFEGSGARETNTWTRA